MVLSINGAPTEIRTLSKTATGVVVDMMVVDMMVVDMMVVVRYEVHIISRHRFLLK